jgi:hypothetical protein
MYQRASTSGGDQDKAWSEVLVMTRTAGIGKPTVSTAEPKILTRTEDYDDKKLSLEYNGPSFSDNQGFHGASAETT